MNYVSAMFTERPYVGLLIIAFWIVAPAERGYLRAGVWFVLGTFVGWAVEASSIRTGFPFGMYIYHADRFQDEFWIAGVPLFASLSFTCLTYFGFSLALTCLSPLERTSRGIQRVESRETALSLKLTLVATLLVTWMDIVVDPVTHLGDYWALGSLYHYDPPGMHFDVPLSNYAGWAFTGFTSVGLNQLVDRWTIPAGTRPKGAYRLPHQPMWSLMSDSAVYVFMLSTTLYLMGNPDLPEGTPIQGILLSGCFFTACYVTFLTVMLRRGFARTAQPLDSPATEAPAQSTESYG